MSHTKGPWRVSREGTLVMGGENEPGERILIARAHYGARPDPSGEQAEANARLIAAAPELLQALERLTRAVQDVAGPEPSESRYGSLWAELRAEAKEAEAAIAKARGES